MHMSITLFLAIYSVAVSLMLLREVGKPKLTKCPI